MDENYQEKYPFTKVNPSRSVPTGELGGTPSGRRSQEQQDSTSKGRSRLNRENVVADILAAAGYRIEQNPEPPTARPMAKTRPGVPRPDYKLEGHYADLYTPEPHTKVKGVLEKIYKKTKQQASRVILDLSESQLRVEAIKAVFDEGRYKQNLQYLEELIVIDKNSTIHHMFP